MVRVSGKQLGAFVRALTGRDLQPRHATYGPLRDVHGEPIDHGLAIYFPAPHSYTGEDVLELQAHGGPVVLQLLVARCLEVAVSMDSATGKALLPGLRLAAPGEFTERAFLNDKLDLAQAEAVADLIDANTEAAARSASRSLGGAFSREINVLRDRLIDLRMLVEATLDFPEEEIDFLEKANARGRLLQLSQAVDGVLRQARQGALLREGLQVVIAGQPNAGKSSLLNALAGAELAIVTPIAGTTRDKVSETIQIEGVPLKVIDTAGLRAEHEASDEVERIGMARSWEAIAQADAVLFLHDLGRVDEPGYAQADEGIGQRLSEALRGVNRVIHVFNKLDAAEPDLADRWASRALMPSGQAVALSAKTGQGLGTLRQLLLDLAGWQHQTEGLFMARQRHVQALIQSSEHLGLAQANLDQQDGALDLLAEELRLAHDALGRITGAFSADDLLGEIFSRFCIGK